MFVFVSGYTCMLAYGGALREQGWATIVTRALRRGLEIYAAFLLLLIAYFVLVWIAGGGSRYLDETNTAFFFKIPGPPSFHAVILQYAPVNTDILPTFVLLHLAFPGLLWLMTRSAAVTLAASFLLYLMVQIFSWHVPAWPSGEMYFNPLAWQLLFVFGAWYAHEGPAACGQSCSRASCWRWRCSISHSASVIALSWQFEALEGFIPDAVAKLIYPIYKSHLAPVRLLHFLSLAVVVVAPDAAGLARIAETIDDGDDPLRRELAGDVLFRRVAGIHGLRGPDRSFRHLRHASRGQRCRDRAHDRGCDPVDLGSQAGPSRAKTVLTAVRWLSAAISDAAVQLGQPRMTAVASRKAGRDGSVD